ncbi:hypothetical protein AJ87_13855 [Rhizobium yanglingense]|nr:hypothetical protein AJ87_13855 [Rhizobium yanglingense]
MPLPENIVNTSSLLLTCAIICETDAIAPVALDVAQFLAGQDAKASDVRVLPTDFKIDVKPYSLITARERALLRARGFSTTSSSRKAGSREAERKPGAMLAVFNAPLRREGACCSGNRFFNPFWSG